MPSDGEFLRLRKTLKILIFLSDSPSGAKDSGNKHHWEKSQPLYVLFGKTSLTPRASEHCLLLPPLAHSDPRTRETSGSQVEHISSSQRSNEKLVWVQEPSLTNFPHSWVDECGLLLEYTSHQKAQAREQTIQV